MVEKVEVTFQAQEWNNDYAIEADREPNRATFVIPFEDAVLKKVDELPSDPEEAAKLLPEDDSLESDELAEHENAPEWVREWIDETKGPYYVETEIIE